ncbi:unnamed protein product [Toxocara canis]|uniref:Small ribosomal subunit protein mS33 n=1 Tax=Toxocara canis TaxID=6265 RepID=A0A183U7R8_TOXCA|nr:unnamed protein product [Toxocara canis]
MDGRAHNHDCFRGQMCAVRVMGSRIAHVGRGISQPTPYGKRMDRLANRIFNEVVRPTDAKSMKVVRVMSAEPLEQRDDKSVGYFPNQPMFHYLAKMLRFHGLFFDDHVVFRQVQVTNSAHSSVCSGFASSIFLIDCSNGIVKASEVMRLWE